MIEIATAARAFARPGRRVDQALARGCPCGRCWRSPCWPSRQRPRWLLFVASGSVALLADLIHNFGDAATAIPLGVAFALRSAQAERWAGLAVVVAIFASACVAGYEAIDRLIDPRDVEALGALAGAGADRVRRKLDRGRDQDQSRSPARQPRADRRRRPRPRRRLRQPGVVASAAAVAAGAQVADPLIGLGITIVILRITWDSWKTVRGAASPPLTSGARSPTPSRGRSGCRSPARPNPGRRSRPDDEADLLVIGGGLTGLWAALLARERVQGGGRAARGRAGRVRRQRAQRRLRGRLAHPRDRERRVALAGRDAPARAARARELRGDQGGDRAPRDRRRLRGDRRALVRHRALPGRLHPRDRRDRPRPRLGRRGAQRRAGPGRGALAHLPRRRLPAATGAGWSIRRGWPWGLAAAARAAGVGLYERSPVARLERDGEGVRRDHRGAAAPCGPAARCSPPAPSRRSCARSAATWCRSTTTCW